MKVTLITSRDNPLLGRLRKLQNTPGAYRKEGLVWLEGDHLARAYLQRCGASAVVQVVVADSAWQRGEFTELLAPAAQVVHVAVLADALFNSISELVSAPKLGLLIQAPEAPAIDALAATVVLDRVQDAGNVGSILRSAAAFGFKQVLALQGTAALWSPKVVRAGMGAHFGLCLIEGLQSETLAALNIPLLAASSHAQALLHTTPLPWPCAWVLGHEGQGVAPALMQQCAQQVRIEQPGGEESLNVAAAAAVCLYASSLGGKRA
jgi:RNA methyltransferase, TrmH family